MWCHFEISLWLLALIPRRASALNLAGIGAVISGHFGYGDLDMGIIFIGLMTHLPTFQHMQSRLYIPLLPNSECLGLMLLLHLGSLHLHCDSYQGIFSMHTHAVSILSITGCTAAGKTAPQLYLLRMPTVNRQYDIQRRWSSHTT